MLRPRGMCFDAPEHEHENHDQEQEHPPQRRKEQRNRLAHPLTGERIRVCAPLDEVFAGVLGRLGWRERIPDRWWPV